MWFPRVITHDAVFLKCFCMFSPLRFECSAPLASASQASFRNFAPFRGPHREVCMRRSSHHLHAHLSLYPVLQPSTFDFPIPRDQRFAQFASATRACVYTLPNYWASNYTDINLEKPLVASSFTWCEFYKRDRSALVGGKFRSPIELPPTKAASGSIFSALQRSLTQFLHSSRPHSLALCSALDPSRSYVVFTVNRLPLLITFSRYSPIRCPVTFVRYAYVVHTRKLPTTPHPDFESWVP